MAKETIENRKRQKISLILEIVDPQKGLVFVIGLPKTLTLRLLDDIQKI